MKFNDELRALEVEIFKPKKDRRIRKIKAAWAAWCRTQEPKPWWKKLKIFPAFMGRGGDGKAGG